MKQNTIEKLMKIWGWFTLVVLILGIPAQFVNKYLLNMDFEPSVLIMFVVSSLFEMLLAIAFIRCKKDLFLVIAMAGQVLYRLIVIIMNLSTVSIFAFINLAIYILLLLFVAINCIEKLSDYRIKVPEGLTLGRPEHGGSFQRPNNSGKQNKGQNRQRNNQKNFRKK